MTEVLVVPTSPAPNLGYAGYGAGIPFPVPMAPGYGYAGAGGDCAKDAVYSVAADGLRETAAASRHSSRNDLEIAGKFTELAVAGKDSTIFALSQAHEADRASADRFAEVQKAVFDVDAKNADRFSRVLETMNQRHIESLQERAEGLRLRVETLQEERRADRQENLLAKILEKLSEK